MKLATLHARPRPLRQAQTAPADAAPAQLLRTDLLKALHVQAHGGRTPTTLLPRLAHLLASGPAAVHTALALPIIYVLRRIARHSTELAGPPPTKATADSAGPNLTCPQHQCDRERGGFRRRGHRG